MHHHDHDCACGHDHHDHHEHQGCGCGCGHDHGHHHHHHHDDFDAKKIVVDTNLTENQVTFLHQLSQYQYLPVCQFIVRSSTQDEFEIVALQPVFIRSIHESMEEVKEAGAFLQQLHDQGMITLDYEIPLDGYSYHEYKESDLFKFFCDTVAESVSIENALGDTAALEMGSMGLTDAAKALLAK